MIRFRSFQRQLGHERFFSEFARLVKANKPIAEKIKKVVKQIIAGELGYSSFNTRRVEGNKDNRFHFVDITDKYRMVIAYEDDYEVVYFYSVGNHDETLKAGERGSLAEHAKYSKIDLTTKAPEADSEPVEVSLFPVLEAISTDSLSAIAQNREKLFDLFEGDVLSTLNGYEAGLLEDWMIFLAPAQYRAVERARQGPFKVTGGPGTGKSVVALHVIKEKLKENPQAKILVTSFVNTVPKVLANLTSRLSGELARDRVDFKTVHKVAMDITNIQFSKVVAPAMKRELIQQAIDSSPRKPNKTRDWLDTEFARVILARMVRDKESYLALRRIGRKVPVMSAERSAIWDVYQRYRDGLKKRELIDWELLLFAAAEHAQQNPPPIKYDTIVVDEAQDVTESGVRMLLAMLNGGADGNIVFIGDSKQRLYAGGYSLKDLGIQIKGRSIYLSLCYRTTEQIMQAVGALGKIISTEEFGEEGVGPTQLDYRLIGRAPEYHEFKEHAQQWEWVVSQLDPDDAEAFDGTAILLASRYEVAAAQRYLKQRNIGFCDLKKYDGRPTAGVKVGTMKRAKSLEFYRVFIPNIGSESKVEARGDEDHLIAVASQLYVAMSRARDRLVLSGVGEPIFLLKDALQRMERIVHDG